MCERECMWLCAPCAISPFTLHQHLEIPNWNGMHNIHKKILKKKKREKKIQEERRKKNGINVRGRCIFNNYLFTDEITDKLIRWILFFYYERKKNGVFFSIVKSILLVFIFVLHLILLVRRRSSTNSQIQ